MSQEVLQQAIDEITDQLDADVLLSLEKRLK
jgi:hypothetical protein